MAQSRFILGRVTGSSLLAGRHYAASWWAESNVASQAFVDEIHGRCLGYEVKNGVEGISAKAERRYNRAGWRLGMVVYLHEPRSVASLTSAIAGASVRVGGGLAIGPDTVELFEIDEQLYERATGILAPVWGMEQAVGEAQDDFHNAAQAVAREARDAGNRIAGLFEDWVSMLKWVAISSAVVVGGYVIYRVAKK